MAFADARVAMGFGELVVASILPEAILRVVDDFGDRHELPLDRAQIFFADAAHGSGRRLSRHAVRSEGGSRDQT